MKLSIVTTLYKSAAYIEEFLRRSAVAAKQLVGDDYEIILVNDGSPDNSLDVAVHMCRQDPHISVVDLSRNFGHHKAMMTGLDYSRGERVYLIDSDLEEEPEWLLDFAGQMEEAGCDVVYGVQDARKGGWFERVSGKWFYRIFNYLAQVELPENLVTARLMSRRYVDALLKHDEREVFMAGLLLITGFEQRPAIVKKHSKGSSSYTFRHRVALVVNSITSFSNAPLVGIFYIGVVISLIAGCYMTYGLSQWLLFTKPLSGWTSLIASIWLLGGLNILFIGIVGIYISKVFSEAKRRPYTIVRQVFGKRRENDGARRVVPEKERRKETT